MQAELPRPVPELDPGTAVERYEVLGSLGLGGMATVYFARHRQLGTVHALKVLAYDLPSFRRRALQEGQVQAALAHPNIVTVARVVTHRGVPALVMEFVAGPSLDRLAAERAMSLDEIDLLARDILTGAAHAHARGVVHRDLKLANVLVAPVEGGLRAKITDFGLVKMLTLTGPTQQTQAGTVMGTPPYMSPEQLTDASQVDARTDVWALGVVLYELCTGHRPFHGATREELLERVLSGQYPAPETFEPQLPPRMRAAIRAALQPDRDARCANARELLDLWVEGAPAARDAWRPETIAAARRLAPEVPAPAPRPQPVHTSNRRPASDPPVVPAPPSPPAARRAPSLILLGVAALGAASLLLLR